MRKDHFKPIYYLTLVTNFNGVQPGGSSLNIHFTLFSWLNAQKNHCYNNIQNSSD